MIFGFNTDVPGKDAVYHVQTEDRGEKNPVIDSTIYVGGKIVDRRRTSYVPSEVTPEQIKEIVRKQHKDLVDAIRAGTFSPSGTHLSDSTPSGYDIQLLNPAALAQGDQLQFEVSFRKKGQEATAREASVDTRWVLGSVVAESRTLRAEPNGKVVVSFPIPVSHTEAALLICIKGLSGRTFAKFRVHATTA